MGLTLSLSACSDDGRSGVGTDGTEGISDATGWADDNDDNGDGDGDPPATTGGDGDAGGAGDTGGDGDGDDEASSPVKWDVNHVPDLDAGCGAGWGVELEFSYLWAANSSQGTISKIDTKTVTEVGRYIVRPDSGGSPSRTSVSLTGHVAVANRNGGVTKIYADPKFCKESNGIPGIQTSTSPIFLPWDEEECIAWYRPMNYNSQRPVAWGPGTFNKDTCEWENEELWTAGTNQDGKIDIYVLDGDDGTTKEMISVPTGANGLNEDFFGIYGAAVDGDGNFWGSQLGTSGRVIRVNRDDMSYDIWNSPAGPHWYGMTVDNEGMLWLCSASVARFDPLTEIWTVAEVGGWTGCMADAKDNGLLWMSNGNGVIGINRDTLQVEKNWASAGSYGISIDFEGYVWAVASGANASKINPDTGEFTTYSGLVGAYTYSDMTGYALSNAGKPSG